MPSGSGASKKRKWYLFDNMLFLSDYVMQHKKMESNLSGFHIDHYENDSFVEEPVVPDSEENHGKKQEGLSETIDTEELQNDKSTNKPVFKKPKTNRKILPSEKMVEPMLELLKTRTQAQKKNEDTPELSFFKSIIPDFLKLNDKNQRQFKKIVLNTINQLLDCQEDNTPYYEMPRYNDPPHTNIKPLVSKNQLFNVENQPQQFNAIQYIASSSSPDFSSSESSSSF